MPIILSEWWYLCLALNSIRQATVIGTEQLSLEKKIILHTYISYGYFITSVTNAVTVGYFSSPIKLKSAQAAKKQSCKEKKQPTEPPSTENAKLSLIKCVNIDSK